MQSFIVYLQLMTSNSELCHVGQLTSLPTALQQRYNTLQGPQCTNLTYIRTFYHKMLTFNSDPDIRNIYCHLHKAAGNLNLINVSVLM